MILSLLLTLTNISQFSTKYLVQGNYHKGQVIQNFQKCQQLKISKESTRQEV